MQLLVVEDDENKIGEVIRFLNDRYPSMCVSSRRSFQSGLKEIILGKPDLILLDMTMPTYDVSRRQPGGRERRYGGQEILRQMQRRGIQIPVIIITQYEQFEEAGIQVTLNEFRRRLKEAFPMFFRDAVFYQASGIEWMERLVFLLDTEIYGKRNED